MRVVLLLVIGWILATASFVQAGEAVGESLDLSGSWSFQTDPLDVGRSHRWFVNSEAFSGTIQVPGSWNAQGVTYQAEALRREYEEKTLAEHKHLYGLGTLGKETESAKLFSVFPGPAWYRKTITIPAKWKGKDLWLEFGGVHRQAEVWINGRSAGSHHSYLTSFQINLSSYVQAGERCTITVRVDARREKDRDPLLGCFDTLDFLYITWGGLHGRVTLAARESTRFRDVFVIPRLAEATAEVRLEWEGLRPDPLLAAIEVRDAAGSVVARAEQALPAAATQSVLRVSLPNAQLWSPRSPYLYRLEARLRSGPALWDTRSVRFGMREFKVADGKFLLNGQPIFLRGYGDDCIFPNSICPPADRGELARRLLAAREYGFNYVRHHSWIPTEEYLDAADELGMMLQPEFPFAYRWDLPTTEEAKRSAIDQWTAVIRRHRHHPSIVTWCMGNELYDSFDLALEMYRLAKELDPTRPVIDSDGSGFKHEKRETLDFLVVQFGEGHSVGFGDGKYNIPAGVAKPVIAHEMGYFVTLPDLQQLPLFGQGLRPYWLTQTRDLVARRGLEAEYPAWLRASYQLQAVCLKSNLEAARRSRLSGTSVWLFQDYPNCAEGVVDMFFRPKGIAADEFRQFNAPTVLLLDIARRNWRDGEAMEAALVVSRFEEESSSGTLRWSLQRGEETLASGVREQVEIASGGVHEVGLISLKVPNQSQAEQLTLRAELSDPSGTISNAWNIWTFPHTALSRSSHKVRAHGFDAVRRIYPWTEDWNSQTPRADTHLLITTRLDPEVRKYLAQGGRVWLLNPEGVFSVEKTNFRLSSWDGGGPSGTVVDTQHPAMRAMRTAGWCDLQFYHLIQDSRTIALSALPVRINPIVRCIDRPTRLEDRAYLFEAGVERGKLLVSGFNLHGAMASGDPGALYLFDALLRYAIGEEFQPVGALPLSTLMAKDVR